jgi:hypothetical protein
LGRSGDEDSGCGGGGGGGRDGRGGPSIGSSILDKPPRRLAVPASGVPIGPNLHHSQIRPMSHL